MDELGSVFSPWVSGVSLVCGLKIPYVKSSGFMNFKGLVVGRTYLSGFGVDVG